VVLGNVNTRSTATIYSPVNGIQLTNAPTTFRRSFGSYRLSDQTEPDWVVELYVNNVLVDYTRADASGFFSLDVPLMYGTNLVKLRFYGPWGEERSEERNISIPFNFLPANEFEYNLTAGIVDDERKSKFTRGSFNYGVDNRFTLGAGAEYLSSVDARNPMPFVNASYRLSPGVLISAEHNFNVQSKAILRYQLASGMQVELNYVKYQKDQKAITAGKGIPSNYKEEKRATIFLPLHTKKMAGFARLDYNETGYYGYQYTMADMMLSADTKSFGVNLTNSAVYSDPKKALIFSTLAMNFRLPHRLRILPQARYEFKAAAINLLEVDLEKGVFKNGFLNAGYSRDLPLKNTNISIGLRYTFSFAQASVAYLENGNKQTYMQSARGTLLFNDQTNRLQPGQQSGASRGGLLIMPYLDINDNNKWDKGEPKVEGLGLRVNGGKIVVNKKDTTLEVSSLEAYSNYLIELDNTALDNIAWQLPKKSIQVTVEPNHYKKIEVPVQVMAEVSGKVVLQENGAERGIGKIIINIYRDSSLVASTLTEADGFFSYMGLTPGKYIIKTDHQQLNKIKMQASGDLRVTIYPNGEGPVVGGLNFILQPLGGKDTKELKNNYHQSSGGE
jgi:hypothetical protein